MHSNIRSDDVKFMAVLMHGWHAILSSLQCVSVEYC